MGSFPSADGAGGDPKLRSECDTAQVALEAAFSKGYSQGGPVKNQGVRNHPYSPDHEMAKWAQKGHPLKVPIKTKVSPTGLRSPTRFFFG